MIRILRFEDDVHVSQFETAHSLSVLSTENIILTLGNLIDYIAVGYLR